MKNKILCFDLDNVICSTKKNYYNQSKPKKNIVKFVNYLYDKNYYIKIFTARGMGQYNKNKKEIKKYLGNLTKNQLKKWGVKYHELIFFKPSYDIFVDDKSLGFSKKWPNNLIKKLKLKL